MLDLTMDMMTYGLSEEVVAILIAVAGSVIILLIIIIITACLYCGEKKDDKGAGNVENYLHCNVSSFLVFSSLRTYPYCVTFVLFGH